MTTVQCLVSTARPLLLHHATAFVWSPFSRCSVCAGHTVKWPKHKKKKKKTRLETFNLCSKRWIPLISPGSLKLLWRDKSEKKKKETQTPTPSALWRRTYSQDVPLMATSASVCLFERLRLCLPSSHSAPLLRESDEEMASSWCTLTGWGKVYKPCG